MNTYLYMCMYMCVYMSDTGCRVYMFLSFTRSVLSPSSPSYSSWLSVGWFFSVSLDLLKLSSC